MENKFTTPEAVSLRDALEKRGIHSELEYWDGYKHVDVAILSAKIFIEVDGFQHVTDPKQIIADFKREHYSDISSFHTMHIANEVIRNHLEEIADAIVAVVKMPTT